MKSCSQALSSSFCENVRHNLFLPVWVYDLVDHQRHFPCPLNLLGSFYGKWAEMLQGENFQTGYVFGAIVFIHACMSQVCKEMRLTVITKEWWSSAPYLQLLFERENGHLLTYLGLELQFFWMRELFFFGCGPQHIIPVGLTVYLWTSSSNVYRWRDRREAH